MISSINMKRLNLRTEIIIDDRASQFNFKSIFVKNYIQKK